MDRSSRNHDLPNDDHTFQFNDQNIDFVHMYPLLNSILNQESLLNAMQGRNAVVSPILLSNEIVSLANSFSKLENDLRHYENDYDTLPEKNCEFSDVVSDLKTKATTTERNTSTHCIYRSAQHPDPDVFSADNIDMHNHWKKNFKALYLPSAYYPDLDVFSADNVDTHKEHPVFIRKINMKFVANKD